MKKNKPRWKILTCGNGWREDVSRTELLKILSNISESMENREKSKKLANEILVL